MIHIIRARATQEQMTDMLQALGDYIKVAVDIRRSILAGGGEMHADCEQQLLEDGSSQADIWGADWLPNEQLVAFQSLINIRPGQGNRHLEIESAVVRAAVERIVISLMGSVEDV